MTYSYATERKIRIIESTAGPDWKTVHAGMSIDAIYNKLVGDTRKNLFCKIDATTKDHLDVMVRDHKTGMADFIGSIIEAEYIRHIERCAMLEREIAGRFSG